MLPVDTTHLLRRLQSFLQFSASWSKQIRMHAHYILPVYDFDTSSSLKLQLKFNVILTHVDKYTTACVKGKHNHNKYYLRIGQYARPIHQYEERFLLY